MTEHIQLRSDNVAIACTLAVFSDEQRERHLKLAQTLFGEVLEVRILSDGYALRLPDAPQMLFQLADFINDDRLCCSFINFGVEVEAHHGPIWLTLRGDVAVRAYIVNEMASMLPDQVASAAGLR